MLRRFIQKQGRYEKYVVFDLNIGLVMYIDVANKIFFQICKHKTYESRDNEIAFFSRSMLQGCENASSNVALNLPVFVFTLQ